MKFVDYKVACCIGPRKKGEKSVYEDDKATKNRIQVSKASAHVGRRSRISVQCVVRPFPWTFLDEVSVNFFDRANVVCLSFRLARAREYAIYIRSSYISPTDQLNSVRQQHRVSFLRVRGWAGRRCRRRCEYVHIVSIVGAVRRNDRRRRRQQPMTITFPRHHLRHHHQQ